MLNTSSHVSSSYDPEMPFLSLLALSSNDLCCPSVGNLVYLVTKVTDIRKTSGSIPACLLDSIINSWKQVMQDHESTQHTLLDTVHAKKWKHIRSNIITSTNKSVLSGDSNIITHKIQQKNNEQKTSVESDLNTNNQCNPHESSSPAENVQMSSSTSSSIPYNNTCTDSSPRSTDSLPHSTDTGNNRQTTVSSSPSSISTSPLKMIDSGGRLSRLSTHLEISGILTPNKQNQKSIKPICQVNNITNSSIIYTTSTTTTNSVDTTTNTGTTTTTNNNKNNNSDIVTTTTNIESTMNSNRLSTNQNDSFIDDNDGYGDIMEPFLESRGPGRKRLTKSAENHLKHIIKSLIRKYNELEQSHPEYSKATMWSEMGIVFTSDTEKDYAFKMLRGKCLPAIFRFYLKHYMKIDAFIHDFTKHNEDDNSNKYNEESYNDKDDEKDVDDEEDQKEPWKVKSHSRGGYVLSEEAKQQLQVISDSLINIYNQKHETEPSLSRTAMYENMGIVFNDKQEKDYALKIMYPKFHPTGYRFYLKNKQIIDQFIAANQNLSINGKKKRSRVFFTNNSSSSSSSSNKKQRRDSDNNGNIDYGNIEDSTFVESCTLKIKQLKERQREIDSILLTSQTSVDEKQKQIQQLQNEIKAIIDSTKGLDDEKEEIQVKIDGIENVVSLYVS